MIAVAVVALAFAWRNRHRVAGSSRLETFRTKMKIIFLVLAVCGLCSKAVVQPSPPRQPHGVAEALGQRTSDPIVAALHRVRVEVTERPRAVAHDRRPGHWRGRS